MPGNGRGWFSNLTGSIGDGLGDLTGWLTDRPGGPTSDAAAADRNNFITPGGADRANRLNDLAAGYGNRAAPTAQDSAFRGDQAALISRLRGQMNGEQSLSNLQLRGATDGNIAQQRSLAASATPGNAAMMQRVASQNIGRMNQGFGHQAAMLGIQERNAAANALGAVAGQGRQQDNDLSRFNASAQLQQTGLNDQAAGNARGQELANAELRQRGNMGYEQNETQRRGQDLGVPTQPANWERLVGAAGAVIPLLAKGGVVTQPTQAIIGEAGPEAVIPLAKLPDLVERLSSNMGNGAVAARTKQTASKPAPAPTAAELMKARFANPVEHERDHEAEFPWVREAIDEELRQELRASEASKPAYLRGR
jgi:hypothetical protein